MIGGVLLALVILLVVGIGIIFNQRKKQNYKPTKEKGTKPPFCLLHSDYYYNFLLFSYSCQDYVDAAVM